MCFLPRVKQKTLLGSKYIYNINRSFPGKYSIYYYRIILLTKNKNKHKTTELLPKRIRASSSQRT